MPLKRKYVDDEAGHSGDDTSDGGGNESNLGSDEESDDSMVCGDDEVEFEEGAEHEKIHQRELNEEDFEKTKSTLEKKRLKTKTLIQETELEDALEQQLKQKQKKQSPKIIDESVKSKQSSFPLPKKLTSNKILDESQIPPKPTSFLTKNAQSSSNALKIMNENKKKFVFRVTFTNGNIFLKFLLPVANAVQELRFNFTSTEEFKGLRLEAHDTFLTLANKSRYECDIESGGDEKDEELAGLSFCVQASSFLQTLNCATLPDTVLTITKYCDNPDKITFESITNENDVKTVYTCDLLAESRLESLKGMQFNLGYHVNIYLKTLKEQTTNAKKCGASSIYFALYQIQDKEDDTITHSKLSVGFKGQNTSGCHDFYQSAKKIEKKLPDQQLAIEWDPIPCLKSAQMLSIEMKRVSYNEYDNNKLRLFLNHMDIEWVLLHLCNDGTARPLVMECEIGGKNTKHTIIVAPKMDVGSEE